LSRLGELLSPGRDLLQWQFNNPKRILAQAKLVRLDESISRSHNKQFQTSIKHVIMQLNHSKAHFTRKLSEELASLTFLPRIQFGGVKQIARGQKYQFNLGESITKTWRRKNHTIRPKIQRLTNEF